MSIDKIKAISQGISGALFAAFGAFLIFKLIMVVIVPNCSKVTLIAPITYRVPAPPAQIEQPKEQQ